MAKKKARSPKSRKPLDPAADRPTIEQMIRDGTRRRHSARPYDVVQPDYRLWAPVKPGMTRADVHGLLGEPIRRYRGMQVWEPHALYGFLELPRLPTPVTYDFLVGYGEDGRVAVHPSPR